MRRSTRKAKGKKSDPTPVQGGVQTSAPNLAQLEAEPEAMTVNSGGGTEQQGNVIGENGRTGTGFVDMAHSTSLPVSPIVQRRRMDATGFLYRSMRRTFGVLSTKINSIEDRLNEQGKLAQVPINVSQDTTMGQNDESELGIPQILPSSEIVGGEDNQGLEAPGTATMESAPQLSEGNVLRPAITMCNVQNMEKPKFSNKGNIHPVTFIEDLKSYLKRLPREGKEIDLIVECLIGEVRDWARIYKSRWATFEDFREDFLKIYWGETEQSILRRNIVHSIWDKQKHPTMLGHFLQLTGQSQMLTFQIPETQLVTDVIRHYPRNVQSLWSLSKITTIIETAEFLRGLDDISKQEIKQNSNVSQVPGQQSTIDKRKRDIQRNYQSWRKPEQSGNSNFRKGPNNNVSKVTAVIDCTNDNQGDLN